MSIKTGKFGKVSWDPTGGSTLVEIISLNAWTLSEETEMEDVTCFGDTNKVYVPGMKDLKGDVSGFWNCADLALWKAADAGTPGTLQLDRQQPGARLQVAGTRVPERVDRCVALGADGQGHLGGGGLVDRARPDRRDRRDRRPARHLHARRRDPAGQPRRHDRDRRVPATNWTIGQHVEMGNGLDCNWNGTAWVAGSIRNVRRARGARRRGDDRLGVAHGRRVPHLADPQIEDRSQWSLVATVTRADAFKLQQRPLLFTVPRKGGHWVLAGEGRHASRTHR